MFCMQHDSPASQHLKIPIPLELSEITGPFFWNDKVVDGFEQINHNIAGICELWKCISY